MEGWVDQGDQLHTEMVYPPADSHPSKYYPGPVWSNGVDWSQRANHYTTPPPKSLSTLSQRSETVAEFRKSATVAVVSPFSATVALFCDSMDRA